MDVKNKIEMKNFQDNLAKYLKGFDCNLEALSKSLRAFPNCIYSQPIYRGLHFNHVVDQYDIKDSELCSWTTDIGVAMNFASKGRYKVILISSEGGIDIIKLLSYLNSNNLMFSDELKACTYSKYEKEVIASLNTSLVHMLQPL